MKIGEKELKNILSKTSLMKRGKKELDSIEIITIVSILEKKLKINIDGRDINFKNFNKIENILKLIKKYKKK